MKRIYMRRHSCVNKSLYARGPVASVVSGKSVEVGRSESGARVHLTSPGGLKFGQLAQGHSSVVAEAIC